MPAVYCIMVLWKGVVTMKVLENVVITPHTAALTAEGKRNMAEGAAEQIVKNRKNLRFYR